MTFLVPVLVVLGERDRVALHVVREPEWPRSIGVLPLPRARVGDLLRHDAGVVAPAEPIVPF